MEGQDRRIKSLNEKFQVELSDIQFHDIACRGLILSFKFAAIIARNVDPVPKKFTKMIKWQSEPTAANVDIIKPRAGATEFLCKSAQDWNELAENAETFKNKLVLIDVIDASTSLRCADCLFLGPRPRGIHNGWILLS